MSKTCHNCAHRIGSDPSDYKCSRVYKAVNVLVGGYALRSPRYCEHARAKSYHFSPYETPQQYELRVLGYSDYCGPDGLLWEPRITWWQRFKANLGFKVTIHGGDVL